MSLADELIPYMDQDSGLLNPGIGVGSNNGVMYTGEAMYVANSGYGSYIPCSWVSLMFCFKVPGLLMRHPDGGGGQEGPDDYLGVCLADKILFQPRRGWRADMFSYGIRHLGVFRNDPAAPLSSAFLWRQPQLIAAMSINKWHPLSVIGYVVAAVSIFFSCRNKPTSDADSRRLAWMLIQLTADVSWLCKLASKGWYKRLGKDYGPEGMRAVSAIYYGADHPLVRWHQAADGSYPKSEELSG